MKRLIISAFAAFALIAAATTMLRSHTAATDRAVGSADAMSLQQLHSAPGVNKLPIEEYEDQSLVFSRTKP
jgi:LPS O-antigen subunit length determinant protein (WzzB/FepE family)